MLCRSGLSIYNGVEWVWVSLKRLWPVFSVLSERKTNTLISRELSSHVGAEVTSPRRAHLFSSAASVLDERLSRTGVRISYPAVQKVALPPSLAREVFMKEIVCGQQSGSSDREDMCTYKDKLPVLSFLWMCVWRRTALGTTCRAPSCQTMTQCVCVFVRPAHLPLWADAETSIQLTFECLNSVEDAGAPSPVRLSHDVKPKTLQCIKPSRSQAHHKHLNASCGVPLVLSIVQTEESDHRHESEDWLLWSHDLLICFGLIYSLKIGKDNCFLCSTRHFTHFTCLSFIKNITIFLHRIQPAVKLRLTSLFAELFQMMVEVSSSVKTTRRSRTFRISTHSRSTRMVPPLLMEACDVIFLIYFPLRSLF